MKPILEDYQAYVAWLRTQCDVVDKGLAKKQEIMAEDVFSFMRATYFRWAKTAPLFASHLADAPLALCVGDIHVENFGTWVDAEGRRVWGVNDFDEGAVMPYALDLVRLLVSADLAPALRKLRASEAASAILRGYRAGLDAPGPIVVEQGGLWLRTLLAGLQEKAAGFWAEYLDYKPARPPEEVRRALVRALPPGTVEIRFFRKQKGAGSLGRPRFFALGQWNGGTVCREAKAIVPSAWDWSSPVLHPPRGLSISDGKFRSADASLVCAGGFVIRRIASDARKLDLSDVKRTGRGVQMLRAMAADLASIHRATADGTAIANHLAQQPVGWLSRTAASAQAQVRADFREWKSAYQGG